MFVAFAALILGTVGVRLLAGQKGTKAEVATAQSQAHSLWASLTLYVLDTGTPPTEVQGFSVLFTNPGTPAWKGPYFKQVGETNAARRLSIPLDPWGKPYQYRLNGKKMSVISAGPDGKFDTADDVKFEH